MLILNSVGFTKVEELDDIQNIPSTVGGGSEVKPTQQDIKQEETVQETSSANINTSELPPHIVLGMPALSPTMVRRFELRFVTCWLYHADFSLFTLVFCRSLNFFNISCAGPG